MTHRDLGLTIVTSPRRGAGTRAALVGDAMYAGDSSPHAAEADDLGCSVRQLPPRLLVKAAIVAARVNPVNAPALTVPVAGAPVGPMLAAAVTAKYWGPTPRTLSVSFMDSPTVELRRRIIDHLNAWAEEGCVTFAETNGTGQVRISRSSGGHWSYLGTDVLLIPPHLPTMNLQAFTMGTSEAEYRRVVRHEAGHTLGLHHEHMRKALVERIDPEKAYAHFLRTQGWNRQTVDQQVLTPLDEASLMATPPDEDSIMCYRLPASITRDGQPIRGGLDINASDREFIGTIYPRAGAATLTADDQFTPYDWPESDDVHQVAV